MGEDRKVGPGQILLMTLLVTISIVVMMTLMMYINFGWHAAADFLGDVFEVAIAGALAAVLLAAVVAIISFVRRLFRRR